MKAVSYTHLVKVDKTAFKGVDTKKMTIKVSGMSAKQLKAFKAQLKKAGFEGRKSPGKASDFREPPRAYHRHANMGTGAGASQTAQTPKPL